MPGGPGTPPSSYFLAQTEARRTEKIFLRPGSPRISGSRWFPPPPLSEGQSDQIPSAFSIPLPWPKHSISSFGKCSFCLCYTYNTSLSLFCRTGTDLSSSLSRFVSYVRSVFNLVAKILGPVEQARLGRTLRLLEFFNFEQEPVKTISLILLLFCRLHLLRCCLNSLIWNKQALTEMSEMIFYRRCHWSGLG